MRGGMRVLPCIPAVGLVGTGLPLSACNCWCPSTCSVCLPWAQERCSTIINFISGLQSANPQQSLRQTAQEPAWEQGTLFPHPNSKSVACRALTCWLTRFPSPVGWPGGTRRIMAPADLRGG